MTSNSDNLDSNIKGLDGNPLHLTIFKHMDEMLQSPDEHGIYQTTKFMVNLQRDIKQLITQEVIREYQTMIKMIDDFKPDPNAPSFGSASGGFERQGFRKYFESRIQALQGGKDE